MLCASSFHLKQFAKDNTKKQEKIPLFSYHGSSSRQVYQKMTSGLNCAAHRPDLPSIIFNKENRGPLLCFSSPHETVSARVTKPCAKLHREKCNARGSNSLKTYRINCSPHRRQRDGMVVAWRMGSCSDEGFSNQRS